MIYVFNAAGRLAVRTTDDRKATETAVNAITWESSPDTVERFRKLIDYELGVLPGKAYNRILAMRRRFPAEAKAYDADFAALDASAEVKSIARLEITAVTAKDYDPKAKRRGKPLNLTRAKVEAVAKKYAALGSLADPVLAQEAKNCIAELKWAAANLK